ncbi:MAG: MmgE/PrpD family protein [Dehalococcoidia bacterium]
MSISEELSKFIVESNVPLETKNTSKLYVLDWIGSCIAGNDSEPSKITSKIAQLLGGHPKSTILSTGLKTSAPLAAFSNAASSHVVEMDDLDRTSISHPGAPIIATALAVAEEINASFDELIESIAIGYEVGIRTGESLGTSHYQNWHTTGTAGTMGSVATACRLYKLDISQTINALGTAGTMASGLWQFLEDGAMSKQLHPAKAAHDGILAAKLSRESFTGAKKIYEGKKGLLNSMSKNPDIENMTNNLYNIDLIPELWKINYVSFKVHASCRHTHAAVDAAIILSQKIDVSEIDNIEVQIYSQALDLLDGMEPISPWAAKFSLPFCVATGLIYSQCSMNEFTNLTILNKQTLELSQKIRIKTDKQLDEMYPKAWPSRVTITMKNSDQISEQVNYPSGDPESDVTKLQIFEKFLGMTNFLIEGSGEIIIDKIFDENQSPKIAEIIELSIASSAKQLSA